MITLPGYGLNQGPFAEHLKGHKFEVIQAADIQVGDILLDWNCINPMHQIPAEITKAKRNGDFVHLCWKGSGEEGRLGKQVAYTYLYGRLTD